MFCVEQMKSKDQEMMECNDGSIPILRKDYHEEGVLKKKGFPKPDALPSIPDSQVGLAKQNNE